MKRVKNNQSKQFNEMLNKLYDITMHNDKDGVCCICGKPYHDYGNNAMPLVKGRCCSECNSKYVMPIRFYIAKNGINYGNIKNPILDEKRANDFLELNKKNDTEAINKFEMEIPVR